MKTQSYSFKVVGIRPHYREFNEFLSKVEEKIQNSLQNSLNVETSSHASIDLASFQVFVKKPLLPEQIDRVETIIEHLFSPQFDKVTVSPIEVKKHV